MKTYLHYYLLLVFFFVRFLSFSQNSLVAELKADSIPVFFDYNRAVLLNGKTLEDKLRQIKEPILRIELIGYTDSLGKTGDNVILASKRMDAVSAFLQNSVWKDVRTDTLNVNETSGYPQSDLTLNRRVDILVFTSNAKKEEPLKVELGKPINLNINFVGGQDVFLEESYPKLERLLEILLGDSTLEVELLGHVCCADDYELSIKRANAVFNFLLKNGISENRMSTEGFSNRKRLVPDTSEANMSLNRRVEAVFQRK